MSFTKRFDDESKKFLKSKNQVFNMQNQKQKIIKSVKEMICQSDFGIVLLGLRLPAPRAQDYRIEVRLMR